MASTFLCGVGSIALTGATPAVAQDMAASVTPAGDASTSTAPSASKQDDHAAIVVTGAHDISGVMEKDKSSTLFGLDKPLVDTPRSITDISDKLLSRYNIKSVYDFTAVAAGTYTGSFFGVPGAIAIRGSVADNYFNGFQGISNFANFPTPVDASSDIEIVRGPPSPIYGSGQVGGFLNFIPKSARGDKTKYIQQVTGDASVTLGSYRQKEATADLAIPVKLGENDGGISLYGKIEDSHSFYRGNHPVSQIAQGTYSTDLGDHLSFSGTYQYLHSNGYLKNIGWNRVTQNLIDNQEYISGSPLEKIVAPGAAFITKSQYYAATGGSTVQFYAPSIGATATPNGYTELDPGTVKLVKLSPRDTDLDPALDINEAYANTGYGGLTYKFDNDSQLKFESFINTLSSRNYQSYGFASVFNATVTEQRLTYKFKFDLGPVKIQTVVGGSYRHSSSHDLGSLDDFVLSEDRRDISVGATADDRFNDPFLSGSNYQWATSIYSKINDAAGFFVTDATLGPVSLTLGGRVDGYDVHSINRGTEVGGVYTEESAKNTPFNYNASLSYKFNWATFYGTYAKGKSLQLTQGGSIDPTLIPTGAYLGGSSLREIGVKSSQNGGRLYIALDAYDQKRSYLSTPATGVASVSAIRTRGVEAELRWLVTRRFGITANGAYQRTRQLGSNGGSGTFITLPSCLTNAGCTGGYGGYLYTLTNYVGLTNGYYIHSSPDLSGSLFATYDFKGGWGVTGGGTYASHTGGFLPGAIRLPSYALFKIGAYIVRGPVRVDLNVDNLANKLYFMANSDTDANANVLPGIGRTFHVKATFSF
ncbi:TonB-dependent siderophore receptor [Sphingomonas abietis]|uniref:TonB-dependent receptor n=1 Tax=Sphingomonas abietis TaxID=3012344 RepID=A0ABY7NPV0_9SPHN|nr:TonB-dependent receptor [Sphingomonas abietis]WBO21959.1 TonB-dependent receptor [Sphingomonas abietis]